VPQGHGQGRGAEEADQADELLLASGGTPHAPIIGSPRRFR
jgi:hypothetical protein